MFWQLSVVGFLTCTLSVCLRGEESCIAEPVFEGESTKIICDFGRDLNPSTSTVTLDHLVGKKKTTLVECLPDNGNMSLCNHYDDNFQFKSEKRVENPSIFHITNATKNMSGLYVCSLIITDYQTGSLDEHWASCGLEVKDRPTTPHLSEPVISPETPANNGTSGSNRTSAAGSSAEQHSDSLKDGDTKRGPTVPIVSVVIGSVIVVIAGAGLSFICVRKRKLTGCLQRQGNMDKTLDPAANQPLDSSRTVASSPERKGNNEETTDVTRNAHLREKLQLVSKICLSVRDKFRRSNSHPNCQDDHAQQTV